MASFPNAQQFKELSLKLGKEDRPNLFKSLQESRELWRALTARFSYPFLQCGKDYRPVLGRGERVKLVLKGSFFYFLAQMRLIIKGKYL